MTYLGHATCIRNLLHAVSDTHTSNLFYIYFFMGLYGCCRHNLPGGTSQSECYKVRDGEGLGHTAVLPGAGVRDLHQDVLLHGAPGHVRRQLIPGNPVGPRDVRPGKRSVQHG